MSTRVFISSTSRDLLDHRAAVAKALRYAGFEPIDMADFMARPEGATEACLKEVAESDLFVGIYAWRYGYIPPDAEVSITEQEFIEAERLDKPIFCFMVEEAYDWPEEYKEGGISARLLRDFKSRLDAKLVRTTFTTPDDLATRVLASLQRWERDNPQGAAVAPQSEQRAAPTASQPATGGVNISGISSSGPVKVSGIVTGSVSGGDVVGGDQVGGDKVGGDVIHSGTKVGGDYIVGATSNQEAALAELRAALARWQKDIEAKIETASDLDDDDKEYLRKTAAKVQDEAKKGTKADPGKVEGFLNKMSNMAPDILDVTAATLQNPFKGVGLVLQKISDRIKLERQQ